MMTLKILFHMDVKWRNRKSGGNEEAGGSNPLSSTIFQNDLERAKHSYRGLLPDPFPQGTSRKSASKLKC